MFSEDADAATRSAVERRTGSTVDGKWSSPCCGVPVRRPVCGARWTAALYRILHRRLCRRSRRSTTSDHNAPLYTGITSDVVVITSIFK